MLLSPKGCPSLRSAVDHGQPIRVECKTICDGVAVPYITDEMFPFLSELIDDVLLVLRARGARGDQINFMA